jgi:urea transport system permease protein
MLARIMALVLTLLVVSIPAYADYERTVMDLNQMSFVKKQQALNQLMNTPEYALDTRTISILTAFADGQLFFVKSKKRLVTVEEVNEGKLARDVLTGETLGVVTSSDAKRVVINNGLRGQVKGALAGLQLASSEPSVRMAAAKSLVVTPDAGFLGLLDAAIAREKEADVLKALQIARAMIQIKSDDVAQRRAAVESLDGALEPEVITLLTTMTGKSENGEFVEPDENVRNAALAVLKSAERTRAAYKSVEDVIFGISLGSVLLLSAVGLAITFGVMGVINMAHGEMMMIGAYTTYVIQQLMPHHIEYSLLLAVPAAFLVAGLVGVLMERGMIRFLYGRPLETLLATFGISLILQQAARSIFSPLNKAVSTPEWMSGLWQINPALSITFNRFYIIIFSLLVFAGLIIALKKTMFGLQMRAVTQNRAMASSMGIRTGWVDAMTFGLGSGIAGIAGVALSQLTNVGPNLGQAYIVDSFMVVVFGGVGNLFGTLFGALTLGIANKLMEPMTGAVLAKILVLVFIILFIQRKPRGMFALKGRFVEG